MPYPTYEAGMFAEQVSSTPAPRHGAAIDDPYGTARLFERDEVIFWEGDPATSFYQVAAGAVRSCKLLDDGRRQIVAFHVVDEIFGIECSQEHQVCAEAINPSNIVAFPQISVDALARCSSRTARDVLASALLSLERAQRHTIVLGRKLAPERIATFLLDMADRVQSDSFELPMSRMDIADYLGLTTETVSRTLTQFAREALIQISSAKRGIVLRDKPALRRLHEGALPSPLHM